MRLSILASILVAALAAPVAAQPGVTSPEPPAVTEEREWYGYLTLAADGAALAVGAATGNGAAGLGVYALGGPGVHLYKGNYPGAALSLAVRIGLPLGLGLWGRHDDEQEETGSGHADEASYGISNEAAGIILGILGASLLDAIVLARRTVKVEAAPSWTLNVTTSNGVAVGVGGSW